MIARGSRGSCFPQADSKEVKIVTGVSVHRQSLFRSWVAISFPASKISGVTLSTRKRFTFFLEIVIVSSCPWQTLQHTRCCRSQLNVLWDGYDTEYQLWRIRAAHSTSPDRVVFEEMTLDYENLCSFCYVLYLLRDLVFATRISDDRRLRRDLCHVDDQYKLKKKYTRPLIEQVSIICLRHKKRNEIRQSTAEDLEQLSDIFGNSFLYVLHLNGSSLPDRSVTKYLRTEKFQIQLPVFSFF